MARASGVATPTDVSSAEFFHAPSRVRYRLYSENGAAWLSFEGPGDRSVRGKRQLLYFIGSGHRGRTYLFAEDGFVFEAPINWYAQKGVWDMAPAFQSARQIPMTFAGTAGVLGLPHQRSGTGLVRAKADPSMIEAATNLGVIEAHQARMDVAVPLWEDAFRRAPAHSAIGMNLARVYCGGGEFARAREIVERVLQFDPDLPQAKELERQLFAQPPTCSTR